MLGAVIFNLINVVRHIVKGDITDYFAPYFNLENMIGFVFLAVISTIVATSMNNYAVSKVRLSTASAFPRPKIFADFSRATTAIPRACILKNSKTFLFNPSLIL